MSNKANGGAAFPVVTRYVVKQADMSLRDWFAGQALCGLLANSRAELARPHPTDVSNDAYAYADAMLKEREEG